MNIFLMVLTCLNIILVLGLSFSVFLRVKEKKEDQRITKGLQLLQHKISILQDLSDKTDEQVQRLVYMLDSKSNELRRLTLEANEAVHTVQDTLSRVTANPSTITPNATTAMSTGLDEFSQFVHALSLQNEKIKPMVQTAAPIVDTIPAVQNNLPQDFVGTTPEVAVIETSKNTVRPFQFRRVTKV